MCLPFRGEEKEEESQTQTVGRGRFLLNIEGGIHRRAKLWASKFGFSPGDACWLPM